MSYVNGPSRQQVYGSRAAPKRAPRSFASDSSPGSYGYRSRAALSDAAGSLAMVPVQLVGLVAQVLGGSIRLASRASERLMWGPERTTCCGCQCHVTRYTCFPATHYAHHHCGCGC